MSKQNKLQDILTDDQLEVYNLNLEGLSHQQIADDLGVTYDTVRGRIRRAKKAVKESGIKSEKISEIEKMTQEKAFEVVSSKYGLAKQEFKDLVKSATKKPSKHKHVVQDFSATGSIKALVISDTHIGYNKFHEELFMEAVNRSKDCDVVLHPGDHVEGMSGRDGHIYELSEVGYQAQLNKARELYSLFDKPMYGIDGNHDQWAKIKGNAGLIVGEELDLTVKNYTHLGEWEGDFVVNNLIIKLFHANDGSAYANSYKGQKLVESFTGGEKPHVVLSGHYHKALYQFTRNVHQYECGTICGQSVYMRGKKLAAHMGFWVLTINYNKLGVSSIKSEFVPGYE